MEVMIDTNSKSKRQEAKRRSHYMEQRLSPTSEPYLNNTWTSHDIMNSDNSSLPDWDIPSPDIGSPQRNRDDEIFRWEECRKRCINILTSKKPPNFLIFLEECLETLRSTTETGKRMPDIHQMLTSIMHCRKMIDEPSVLEVKKKLRQLMSKYLFMEIECLGMINCENIDLRFEELTRTIIYRIKLLLDNNREILYTFIRISLCIGNNLQKSAVQERVLGNIFSAFLTTLDVDVSNVKQYTLCLLCYRLWRDLSLKRETKERIREEALKKLKPPLIHYCVEKKKFLQCMLLSKISRSEDLDDLMSKLTEKVMTKNNISVGEIYGRMATFFRENNKYHDKICRCEVVCINDEPLSYSERKTVYTEAKTKTSTTENREKSKILSVDTVVIDISDDDSSDNSTDQLTRSLKSTRRRISDLEMSSSNGDNTDVSKSDSSDVDFDNSEQTQFDYDTPSFTCSTPNRRLKLKRPTEITNSECRQEICIISEAEQNEVTEIRKEMKLVSTKEKDGYQLPDVSDKGEKEAENILSVDTQRNDTLKNIHDLPNADRELRSDNSEIEIDSTCKNANEKERKDTQNRSLEVSAKKSSSSETSLVTVESDNACEINTAIKSIQSVNIGIESVSDDIVLQHTEGTQETTNTNSKEHSNDCEQETGVATESIVERGSKISTENDKCILMSNTRLTNETDQQRVNNSEVAKSCNTNIIAQNEQKLITEGDHNTKQLLEITTDQVPIIVNAKESVRKNTEMNIIENFFKSAGSGIKISQKSTVRSENMKKDAQTILTENEHSNKNTHKSTDSLATINNDEIESKKNGNDVNNLTEYEEKERTKKTVLIEVAQDLKTRNEKLSFGELRPEIEKKLICENYDSQNSDLNKKLQKKTFKDTVQESDIRSEEFEKGNSTLLMTQDDLSNKNVKLHKKHKKLGSSLNCCQEENSLDINNATPNVKAPNKESSQDSVKIIKRKNKRTSLDIAEYNNIKCVDDTTNSNKVSNNFNVEITQDIQTVSVETILEDSKVEQKNEFIENMHPKDSEKNAKNESKILDSSVETFVEKPTENCEFFSQSKNVVQTKDAPDKEITEQSMSPCENSEKCLRIQSKESNLSVNNESENLNKPSVSDVNFESENFAEKETRVSDNTAIGASGKEIMEQSTSKESNLVVNNESEKMNSPSVSDVNFESVNIDTNETYVSDNSVIEGSNKEIAELCISPCENSEKNLQIQPKESNLLVNDESGKLNKPSVSESEIIDVKDCDSTVIDAPTKEITQQSVFARKNTENCLQNQSEESNLTVNYESEKLSRSNISKRKMFTMLSSDTKEKYKSVKGSDCRNKNLLNKYISKSAHSEEEHDMPNQPSDFVEKKSCGFLIADILKSADNKADNFVKTVDDKQRSKRKRKTNLQSVEDTNQIKQFRDKEGTQTSFNENEKTTHCYTELQNPQILESCETKNSESSVITDDVDDTILENTQLLNENHSDENLSAKYKSRHNSITENCENLTTNYQPWNNMKPAHSKEFGKSVISKSSGLLPVDLSLECSKKNVSSEHTFLAGTNDVKLSEDLSHSKDDVPVKSREQEEVCLTQQSSELINYSNPTPKESVNIKSASDSQDEILDDNSNISSKTSSVCDDTEVKFVMNDPAARKSLSDVSKKPNSNIQVEFRTNNNEQAKVILSPNKIDSKWWKDPPKKRASTDNQISNDDKHDTCKQGDRLDSLISQLEKRVDPSTKLLEFVNIALRNSNEKPENENVKNTFTTETKIDTLSSNEALYYDYDNDYNHKYPPKVQKYMAKKNKNAKESENIEQSYNTQSQTKISEENSTALEFVLVDNPVIETESTQIHCDQKSEDPLSINVVEANVPAVECEDICIVSSSSDQSAVLPRKNKCKKRKSTDNTENQIPEKRLKLDTNYKKAADTLNVWSDKNEKKNKKPEKQVKFNDDLIHTSSSTSSKKKKSEYPKNEKLRQKQLADTETKLPKEIKYQNYSEVLIPSKREKVEKPKKKQFNEKTDFRKKEKSECQNYSNIIIQSKREKLEIPNQKQSIEIDSPKKAKLDGNTKSKKETIQTQTNTSFEYTGDESSTSKRLPENSYVRDRLLSFEDCGKLKAIPVTEDCNIAEEVQIYTGENTKTSKKREENKPKDSHNSKRGGNVKRESVIPKTNLKSPHCDKYTNSEQASIETKKSSSKNFQQTKNTEKTINSKSKSEHIKNDVKLCAEKTTEINSKLNSCSKTTDTANLEKTTKINSKSNFCEDKKNLRDLIDNDRKSKSVSKTTYPNEKSAVEPKNVQIKSKSSPCNRNVDAEISKNVKSCRKNKSDKDNSTSRNSTGKEKMGENDFSLNFQHKKSKLEKLVDGISKSNSVGEKDARTNTEKIYNVEESVLEDQRIEPISKSNSRIEEPNTDTKTENVKKTNSTPMQIQNINKEKKTKYMRNKGVNAEKLNTEQVSRTRPELDSNCKKIQVIDEKTTRNSNFSFEQHKSDAKCSDNKKAFSDSGQIKRKRSLTVDTKTSSANDDNKIATEIGMDQVLNIEDSSCDDGDEEQCYKRQLLSMPIIDIDGEWNAPTHTNRNIAESTSVESFPKSMPAIVDSDEIKNKRKSKIAPVNDNEAKNSNVSKNGNLSENTRIRKFDPQKIKNPIEMSPKQATVKKKCKIERSKHLTPTTIEEIFESRRHIDNSSESLKPTEKKECKPEIKISERLSATVKTEKIFGNQFRVDNSNNSLIEVDKIDQLISEDMQSNCNVATDNKQQINDKYSVIDHGTIVDDLKSKLVNDNDIPQISTYQVFESYNAQNNLDINKSDHLGIELLNDDKSECINLNENVDIPIWLKENISSSKDSNEEHFANVKSDDVQLHKLDHQFGDILQNKEHFKIDSQINLLPTNQHLDLNESSINNALEIQHEHTNSIFGNNSEHAYADTFNQNPNMIIVDDTFFDIAREETFRDTINPLQNGDFYSRIHENNVELNPEVDEMTCFYYTDSQLTDHDNFEHVYDSEKWVSPRAIDGSQFKGVLEFPSCISALVQDTSIASESSEIPVPVETINSANDINSEQKYGSKDQLLSATPICYKNENSMYDIEIPFDEEKTTELTKKSTLPAHDCPQVKYDTPPVICKSSQNTSNAELQTQNSVIIQIPNVPADVSSMAHFGDCDGQQLEQLILNELETHSVGQDKAHHVSRFETQTAIPQQILQDPRITQTAIPQQILQDPRITQTAIPQQILQDSRITQTAIPQQILQDPRIRNNEPNRQHLSKTFCNSKEVQTKQICRVRPYLLGSDKKNKNELDGETTERESQVYKNRENKNSRRDGPDIFDKVKNSSPKNLPLPLRTDWSYEGGRVIMNKRRTSSSNSDDKSLEWRKLIPLKDSKLF